jgi:hypothetical protein
MVDEDIEVDILNSGKTSASISYHPEDCFGGETCVGSMELSVGETIARVSAGLPSSSLTRPMLTTTINGAKLDDGLSFDNGEVFVQQVSTRFVSIQGFGFRVLFDANGQMNINLDPSFAGKVRGLDGRR